MKDQVDGLCRRGVKAANLDSTLDAARASWVKQEVLSGSMKLLYVAPERCVLAPDTPRVFVTDSDASTG